MLALGADVSADFASVTGTGVVAAGALTSGRTVIKGSDKMADIAQAQYRNLISASVPV